MTEYLLLGSMMLLTGLISGVLAGLLGIGGGIVIVPVLEAALTSLGVDPAIRMHVAVATSLATIIPTSISSSRAHHRRNSIDLDLVKRWAVFVLIGAFLGTFIAAQVDGRVLAAVFAVVALLVAIKMMLPLEGVTLTSAVPRTPISNLIPMGIGTVATMMGIGGGGIAVPILTLCGEKIHRAVGTAALFGLAVSLPGTIGYVIAGQGDPRLPLGSFGYVNLIGLCLIAPMTIMAAPLGAKLAHALSRRHLSLIFGAFLFLISARMFFRALQG